MNNRDRKLLLKNRLALVESVEAKDLLGHLFQDGVISENDKEKIEVQPTRRDQIELLLDTLPRKGPKAFDRFCAILHRLECYQYLALILSPKDYGSESVDPGADDVGAVDVIDASPTVCDTEVTFIPVTCTTASESYISTSTPRGWCFILNNMHFYKHTDRDGSERDADNLQRLFADLGFRVWLVNDANAQDIRNHFQQLALKTDHSDSLVVCILSHGLSGQIYGVDGELVSVSEILTVLNTGPTRKSLLGKPKLFLIQACRNVAEKATERTKKIDSSHVITGGGVLSPNENLGSLYEPFIEESLVQAQSDLILAYSTFPGQVSWRHALNGSFFIDAVVSVFRDHSSSEDVLNMLVKVNARVRKAVGSMQQIPAPVFTLTKKWFLHPP